MSTEKDSRKNRRHSDSVQIFQFDSMICKQAQFDNYDTCYLEQKKKRAYPHSFFKSYTMKQATITVMDPKCAYVSGPILAAYKNPNTSTELNVINRDKVKPTY